MAKYCINPDCPRCGQPQNDNSRFCQECGKELTDHLRHHGGDDNSIHVSRTNNDSHNVVDSHDTIHKITNVYVGKSGDELSLAERKEKYRLFCLGKLDSGIISPKLRRELDDFASEIALPGELRSEIEHQVKEARLASRAELSDTDLMTLEYVSGQIRQNTGSLRSFRTKLEPLANSESDEAQFYYYLVTALENPSSFLSRYREASIDNYWQTFWACYAYAKSGNPTQAGFAQRKLSQWSEFPQENVALISCSGLLLGGELQAAAQFLARINPKALSKWLVPMYTAVRYLSSHGAAAGLSESPECNFYLQKLFQVSDPIVNTPSSAVRSFATAPADSVPTPSPRASDKAIHAAHVATRQIVDNPPHRPEPVSDPITDPRKNRQGWVRIALAIVGIGIGLTLYYGLHSDRQAESDTAQPRMEVAATENQTNDARQSTVPGNTTKQTAAERPSTPQQTATAPVQKPSAPALSTATPAGTASQGRSSSTTVEEKTSDNRLAAAESSRIPTPPKQDPIAKLKAAADTGDKDARFELGMKYYEGDGVKKSYATAFEYLKPLADEGYEKAYFPVAEMYHGGRGVSKDRDMAESWYMKAAKAGNARAKRILMNM